MPLTNQRRAVKKLFFTGEGAREREREREREIWVKKISGQEEYTKKVNTKKNDDLSIESVLKKWIVFEKRKCKK